MKVQTVFIDYGSDYNLTKSIDPDNDFVKSHHGQLDRSKLTYKDVQVHSKHGTYTRKQLVSNGVEDHKKPALKHQEVKDDKKQSKHDSNKPDVKTTYFRKSECGNSDNKPVTFSEVRKDLTNHYNKNKKSIKMSYGDFMKSKQAQQYIKENYFISGVMYDKRAREDKWTTTKGVYKVNGHYTPERQKLHDQIVQQIVDSATTPPGGQKPVAILMGGGSASGKGTCRKNVVMPRAAEVGMTPGICDSDDIKDFMPEYSHFKEQDMESAAYRVHEESSDICNEAIDACVAAGKNLLFDGTMKNYDKYIGVIDKLHKAGYDVQIVGVDVDLNEAYKRSDARAERSGRKVPHGIIYGSHGGFSLTLPKLLSKVDSSILYDNTDGLKPIMADGKVLDQSKYDTFIQKGQRYIEDKRISKVAENFDVDEKEVRNLMNDGATIDELEQWYNTMGKDGWKELKS